MTTLISAPDAQAQEEWLRFGLSGVPGNENAHDVVVVSGYAHYDDDKLVGDPDADNFVEDYMCFIPAGPLWRHVRDVSAIVAITGFYHDSPDTVDKIGSTVDSCTWSVHEPAPFRIQLEAHLQVWGGDEHHIRRLAYHLTVQGTLMPNQDFKENP